MFKALKGLLRKETTLSKNAYRALSSGVIKTK